MENQLSAAIQAAIKDNLSGSIASELQAFVSNANETSRKYELLQISYESSQNEVAKLKSQLSSQKDVEIKLEESKANLRKADAALAEANAKQVECRALVAEAQFATLKDAFQTVFKNTIIREKVLNKSHPVPGVPSSQYNPSGSPGYVTNSAMPEETSRTSE